jgi:hypothetical protein
LGDFDVISKNAPIKNAPTLINAKCFMSLIFSFRNKYEKLHDNFYAHSGRYSCRAR